MSTTYNAAAIVGCKIDKSKVFFIEQVRSCKHPISIENAKFCPECGEEVFVEQDGAIPQYDQDEKTICGFRAFYNEYNDFIIVASEFAEIDFYSEEPKMIDVDTVNGAQLRLKLALEPYNLWDKKQFGIHVFQWCS